MPKLVSLKSSLLNIFLDDRPGLNGMSSFGRAEFG